MRNLEIKTRYLMDCMQASKAEIGRKLNISPQSITSYLKYGVYKMSKYNDIINAMGLRIAIIDNDNRIRVLIENSDFER